MESVGYYIVMIIVQTLLRTVTAASMAIFCHNTLLTFRLRAGSNLTLSKLLTYCMLRPTQPPNLFGRGMSNSLRIMG